MNAAKLLMLTGTLAASVSAHAQMVSYKVVENDANQFQRTNIYLDVFSVDSWLQPTIGSGVKVETMILKRIMPWAQVRWAWTDAAISHVVTGYPTNAGGQKKQLLGDFGAALFLTDKTRTRKLRVTLSSVTAGRTTYSKYLMVPGQVKKLFGFRGGLNIARKALDFDDKSHPYWNYKRLSDGKEMPIGFVGNPTAESPAGEFYRPQSMSTVASVYGGLHLRRVTNLTIHSDQWGTKSNEAVLDLYADVMLCPAVPVRDVVDLAGNTYSLVPQEGARRFIGWRAGVSHHTNRNVGFYYNFEFGQRPGPVMGEGFLENGTFLSLGLGMNIGADGLVGKTRKKIEARKAARPSESK